eukprot:m.17939 g.17939  ORF g.17939 m.17939 type:complete len:300 (+) comp11547_c0_seq1:17-916(+)
MARILDVSDQKYTEPFHIITPPLPRQYVSEDVIIQSGGYGSLWIRIMNSLDLKQILKLIEKGKPNARGAMYVCFKEKAVDADTLLRIKIQGFTFHHFHRETEEFVYYTWLAKGPDRVPAYATSIEGAGCIVLSPDEKNVLCVWENGKWQYPGGAVDPTEAAIETVRREVKEEVGLELDPSFPLLVGAGWNQPKSRDQRVNDHYTLFIGRAVTNEFRLDMQELHKAKWESVDALLAALADYDKATEKPSAPDQLAPSLLKWKDEPYALMLLRALFNYKHKRAFEVTPLKRSYPDPCFSFF